MAVRIGRYEVIRVIASGGMATVHLARTVGEGGFERLVAIKVMHPHIATDPAFVAMFLDEARLAARIRHPNVVATHDVQRWWLSLHCAATLRVRRRSHARTKGGGRGVYHGPRQASQILLATNTTG